MTDRSFNQNAEIIPFLYLLNQLELKASATSKVDPLIFSIVNDTIHLVPYDRAYLFKIDPATSKLIGISGQASVTELAPLVLHLESAVQGLQKPSEAAFLAKEHFLAGKQDIWLHLQKENSTAVYWLPIFYDDKQVLGLWLEQWGVDTFAFPVEGIEVLLREFLLPAYGIAWNRLTAGRSLKRWLVSDQRHAFYLAIGLLLVLFVIRIPLRVVAPCEIVASDPYYIRAPLEGVIREVAVKPGQSVEKGDLLFQYESQAEDQALKSAEQQLLAKKLELDRAAVMGLRDQEQQNQIGILKAQRQREEANLGLLSYQTSLMSVKSPIKGVVILGSNDEWRGKPVKIGEKVLIVSDPAQTKIKIWISESDNVPLDPKKDIKIFLNISPTSSYQAHIDYIANEISISEREIPSFIAEANWVDSPPDRVKIGLKGTAIIYGESVSLFYYFIRRPWYTFRNYVGF